MNSAYRVCSFLPLRRGRFKIVLCVAASGSSPGCRGWSITSTRKLSSAAFQILVERLTKMRNL
jgi:hypothetical protein